MNMTLENCSEWQELIFETAICDPCPKYCWSLSRVERCLSRIIFLWNPVSRPLKLCNIVPGFISQLVKHLGSR